MMSALYTGVSAMNANQVKIDVISNNIANVNTIGYKYQTVSFQDSLNQTISGAQAPSGDSSGGINPMQVGLGVEVASMNSVNTVGSMQYTGNPTDLAISGDGFFIVQDQSGVEYFTRSGNFGVDESGNLVTSDGNIVCGWQDFEYDEEGNPVYNTAQAVEPLNLFSTGGNSSMTLAPQETNTMTLSGNLSSDNTAKGAGPDEIGTGEIDPDYIMPFNTYDSLGNEYQMYGNFTKCYTEESDPSYTTYYYEIADSDGTVMSSGYLKFDEEGQLMDEPGYEAQINVQIALDNSGSGDISVDMDMSALTMYNASSNVSPMFSDGYPAGELMDFSLDASGMIIGVYSNGLLQPLGQIGIATFPNPAGLEKAGNSLYTPTANSGDFTSATVPGSNGAGTLSVGTLEMSNVDLSREFSEMIVAQRGYQASSRIITTVDELLQELLNLKR